VCIIVAYPAVRGLTHYDDKKKLEASRTIAKSSTFTGRTAAIIQFSR
jgi:hypothetical protein